MGIRTMPWSEWMELDESFSFHQRIRTFRVNHCGKTVLCVLPAREDESVKVAGGAEAGSWFLNMSLHLWLLNLSCSERVAV
jgi:hypothetical protein